MKIKITAIVEVNDASFEDPETAMREIVTDMFGKAALDYSFGEDSILCPNSNIYIDVEEIN